MTDTAPWTEQTFVVVDVEGNGQRPPDLVELGIVPIEAGIAGDPVSWLVRPHGKITWQARKIHGISDKDVADQPTFEEVTDDVRQALGNAIPIGHNVKIDLGVLTRELPEWRPLAALDTLRMARKAWPALPTHKLGALVEQHKLDTDIPDGLHPHRVDWDVLVTARLFSLLVTELGITTFGDLQAAGGITLAAPPQPEPSLFD
ncbi:3'-5' exonuclease [Saccharopolyspora hattusasensis]|uniref:3'-5' exonuclease n=1 Tax=Saccharopolyspora hattusasensis TaxID=1128679 RepID=UPI003D992B0C